VILGAVLVVATVLLPPEFLKRHWGDAASLVGLIVSVIGFVWTITVAKQAKQAAEDARNSIFRFDAVIELSQAVEIMQEIMHFHRDQEWRLLPERYSRVRAKIIAVKSSSSSITEHQRTRLTGVWQQLKDIDGKVEACVQSGRK